MAYTTINKGEAQFKATTWAGNWVSGDGAGYSRNITTPFRPGMVWVKARDMSGRSHYLYQEAEGFGANKELVPNGNNQEGDTSNHNTGAAGYVGGDGTAACGGGNHT